MPTCNVCGNTDDFVVTGREVRRTGEDPENTVFHFIITQAVCADPSCAQHPTADVTLDPHPPALASYIALMSGF